MLQNITNYTRSKRSRKGITLLTAVLAAYGVAGLASGAKADPPGSGWTQIFNDTMTGSSVDTSKWSLLSGDTVINSPLTLNRWDSVSEGNGYMRISCTSVNDGTHKYKSAQISTQGKFSHAFGYMEARMKVPGGNYAWPAFWLLPDDGSWPPEIDVVELNGSGWPNTAYQTYHYYDANNQWAQNQHQAISSTSNWAGGWAADWHTYGCEWAGDHISWYIDGVNTNTVWYWDLGVWPTNKSMYLILDLAMGGEWPGTPNGTETIPSNLDVAWVSMWSK